MRTNKVYRQTDPDGHISFLIDMTKEDGLGIGLGIFPHPGLDGEVPGVVWLPGPSGGCWNANEIMAHEAAAALGLVEIEDVITGKKIPVKKEVLVR